MQPRGRQPSTRVLVTVTAAPIKLSLITNPTTRVGERSLAVSPRNTEFISVHSGAVTYERPD